MFGLMLTAVVLSQCQTLPGGGLSCASPDTFGPQAFTVNTPYFVASAPVFQRAQYQAPAKIVGKSQYRARDGRMVELKWDSLGRVTWAYLPQSAAPVAPVVAKTASPVQPGPRKPDPAGAVLKTIPPPEPPIRNEGLIASKVFDLSPEEKKVGKYYASGGDEAKMFMEKVEGVANGIVEANLENDTKKPYVTVFAKDKTTRDAAKERIKKILGNDAHINGFDPMLSTVAEKKFWDGKPTIVFQKPPTPESNGRGPVVARLPLDATDQAIIQGRRLADPDYDPSKDGKDPDDGLGWSLDSMNKTYLAIAAAAFVVVAVLAAERNQGRTSYA